MDVERGVGYRERGSEYVGEEKTRCDVDGSGREGRGDVTGGVV